MVIIMKKAYKIDIDCANCAAKVEAAVNKLEGVKKCIVSFMTGKLTLETDSDDQTEIMKEVIKTAKKIEPDCEITAK